MRNWIRRGVALALLACVAWAGGVRLAGADGDARWSFQTTGEVFGSPAMDAEGNLYFGSRDGKVYSVASDGTARWSFQTGDWVDSSPALSLDETVVYVGSWDNRLYALEAATGAKQWAFEAGNLIVASPAVDAYGNLFFGASDGFFYSLSSDGSLRWSYFVGDEMDSSPAVAEDGTVYVGAHDGSLYAFSNDGELRWSYATRETSDPEDRRIASSPTLGDSGEVYFGGGDGYLYAVDSGGNLLWEFEAGEKIDTGVALAPSGDLVFASRNGFVYALDAFGVLQWESFVGDVFYSTPAVDAEGRVYVGSYVGNGVSGLSVLDATGALVWEYLVLDYVDSSPLIGDGTVYFGSYDGAFYAVETAFGPAASPWSRFGGDRSNRGRRTSTEAEGLSERMTQWLAERGLFGAAAEPCSDQDGDGKPLLIEYLLGSDPERADGAAVVCLAAGGGTAGRFEWLQVTGESELALVWEASADLVTWQPLASPGALVSADAKGDGWYERRRLELEELGAGAWFLRARADCQGVE